jgi:hypothetical protein
VCWAGASPLTATGTVIVDSRTLVIDSDSARSTANLGGGPSAEQVQTIQARLHDAQHLNTAEYPQLRFDADTVLSMNGDRAAVAGVLTIRGITRRVRVPVRITESADAKLRFSGSLRVRQSAFGIRPESVAGVVRVADAIDIRLELTGVSNGDVCQ